jgi:predicted small lipoprotein YifL
MRPAPLGCALAALLSLSLSGCGQKGPLYLPDKKPQSVTPAAPAPAATAPAPTTPKKNDPDGTDPPQ